MTRTFFSNWQRLYLQVALVSLSGVLLTLRAQTNLPVAAVTGVPAKSIMSSQVYQWSDMKVQPSKTGAVRNVFDAPTATLDKYSCHITTLDPGKEPHPPHQHPEEELLVIKEGTLEVVQGNVTNQVAAGGMVFCASNEPHGWRNTSTKPVTYYVIKVYPHDLANASQLEKPKLK